MQATEEVAVKRLTIAILLLTLALGVQAGPPDTRYEVKRGDTLWGIAERFYGDPLYWPFIWETNKNLVKNPHWIFPGQVLIIPPKERLSEEELKEIKAPPKPIFSWQKEAFIIHVPPSCPEGVGMLGKHLLYPSQELYGSGDIVNLDLQKPVKPQQLLMVYRVEDSSFKDPYTSRRLGCLVENLAILKVLKVKGKKALAKIIYSHDPVKEGDLVAPFSMPEPIYKFNEEAPPVRGRVLKVGGGKPVADLMDQVIVNIGSKDGVKPGDVIFAYIPTWHRITAKLVAVHVEPLASTCILYRAYQGIEPGAYVATPRRLKEKR